MLPCVRSEMFLATLNTAFRRSKISTKKNILSVAKVVTFEATLKFCDMEYWRKWCKERTRWTTSKAFPVSVDVMERCSFSVYFWSLSSYCCCIIVASFPYLMSICSFSSIFCTSISSSRCSFKVIWSSLEIAELSSGGIETEIVPIIPEESSSTICLERIFCDIFLTDSSENLSSLRCNNTARIASLLVACQNH